VSSKRGRPAYADPPVEFKIYIPASLAARIKMECYNPLRQNTAYGAQSAFMVAALKEYFNSREAKHNDSSTAMAQREVDTRGPQAHEASPTPGLSTTAPTLESTPGDKGGI
jgi:hypothetical protein